MVNASLNWASIVGIVLAVCGGGLYFLRSFKPALARDYDVFFAAIGLLCGGILFFQGWRLDPILQFGQFLLAGTTVFFAYESVRLRGVATDQARRSSYFDDDQIPDMPRNSRSRLDEEYDQFEDSQRLSRRFRPQDDDLEDEYADGRLRRRSNTRTIPPSAMSRRRPSSRDLNKFEDEEPRRGRSRPTERTDNDSIRNNFGDRRSSSRNDLKRGSRPRINQEVSRQSSSTFPEKSSPIKNTSTRTSIRPQTKRDKVEDASFQSSTELKQPKQTRRANSSVRSTAKKETGGRYTVGTNKKKPRDNSSRFDD